jgi:hypothetical protein
MTLPAVFEGGAAVSGCGAAWGAVAGWEAGLDAGGGFGWEAGSAGGGASGAGAGELCLVLWHEPVRINARINKKQPKDLFISMLNLLLGVFPKLQLFLGKLPKFIHKFKLFFTGKRDLFIQN